MKTQFPVLAVVWSLAAVTAYSQSSPLYDLSWNSLDSGGVTFASAGPYSLSGTAAQVDAGTVSGGVYELTGGFWAPQALPDTSERLSIHRNGSTLEISWSSGASDSILEQSDSLAATAHWTPVEPPPTGPLSVSPLDSTRFYRVRKR